MPNTSTPVIQKERIISPIWLLPILALLLGGWLLYKAWSEAGVRIEIQFVSAQGIIAGQTQIFYHGLDVGVVKNVRLHPNLNSVIVEAEISADAETLLRSDSQFWLVSPTASITEISGLDALVSGNYIALHPGNGEFSDSFIASDKAPLKIDSNGLLVKLHSDTLGSISSESPVYFKQIKVGSVIRYQLNDDQQVELDLLIEPEFSHLVKTNSRFWNVSGFKGSVSLDGMSIETESLTSLLSGGVAFDSPAEASTAESDHLFSLYPNLASAQRGQKVRILTSQLDGVKAQHSKLLYAGFEVGYIAQVEQNHEDNMFELTALIEPQYAYMFNSSTHLQALQLEITFNGIKNAGAVLGATHIQVEYAQGTPRSTFSMRSNTDTPSDGLALTFSAKQVEGLSASSEIIYKGLRIGQVLDIDLNQDEFLIFAYIDKRYAWLLNNNSRFYTKDPFDFSANLDGVNIESSGIKGFLATPIILLNAKGKPLDVYEYPLYHSLEAAQFADSQQHAPKRLTIVSDKLGSIDIGSPVLYRQLSVGKVSAYQLNAQRQFDITLDIAAEYSHLLNEPLRFWHASGLDVEATLAGVKVHTESLKSLIAGGISFDHFSHLGSESPQRLYPDQEQALVRKLSLTFTSDSGEGLSVDMPIKYQGQKIGKIVSLAFSKDLQQLELSAELYHPYNRDFARQGAQFWQQSAEISLNQLKHIDTLVKGDFIAALPGKGKPERLFALSKQTPNHQANDFSLWLSSTTLGALRADSPVLYKQFTVGKVVSTHLATDGAEIQAKLVIFPEYKHLVRDNSIFWNASGLDMKLGLTGADIRMDSLETLMVGGVAFATPDNQPLAEAAKAEQRFPLQTEFNKEWLQWSPSINTEN